MDDEGHSVAFQINDLREVEYDVEVALVVDEIPQDGVDARPVVEVDLTVDGDDHGPARPGDVKARRGAEGPSGVFAAARGDVPFCSSGAETLDASRKVSATWTGDLSEFSA